MIINEDEFLEHYGKKGMQWGVKTQKSYSKNRALNKASRAKDKQKKTDAMNVTRERLRPKAAPARNKSTSSGRKAARADRTADIDRARERINSGAARADRKAARAQYKQDRTSMGSREARNILRSSRRDLAASEASSRRLDRRILRASRDPILVRSCLY